MKWLLLIGSVKGAAYGLLISSALFTIACVAIWDIAKEGSQRETQAARWALRGFLFASVSLIAAFAWPSVEDVRRAYVMSETAEVLNGETAREVASGITKRVDRALDFVEMKMSIDVCEAAPQRYPEICSGASDAGAESP